MRFQRGEERTPAERTIKCRKETLQMGKLRHGDRKWLARRPLTHQGDDRDNAFFTSACPNGTPQCEHWQIIVSRRHSDPTRVDLMSP